MACRICKRGACTESFHSIEEQERFDREKDQEEERRSCAAEAYWKEKQGEEYGSY